MPKNYAAEKSKPIASLQKDHQGMFVPTATSRAEADERHLHIQSISQIAKSVAPTKGKRTLKAGFEPGPLDVICGRGSTGRNHPGNIRFGKIVAENVEKYSRASKLEKSVIVSSIVEKIREASPEGGFVKKEGKAWFEAGDFLAREKVGQRLRDSLHGKYLSSSSSKKRRRHASTTQLISRVDDIVGRSQNGVALKDRVHELMARGPADKSDEDIQKIFNTANSELLAKFKREHAAVSASQPAQQSTDSPSTSEGEEEETKGGHAPASRSAGPNAKSHQPSRGEEKGIKEAASAVEGKETEHEQPRRKRARVSTPVPAVPTSIPTTRQYGLASSIQLSDIEPLSMSDRLFYEPLRVNEAEAERIRRSLQQVGGSPSSSEEKPPKKR